LIADLFRQFHGFSDNRKSSRDNTCGRSIRAPGKTGLLPADADLDLPGFDDAHASLVDGLVLSGGLPRFVAPVYEDGLGMAHGVTPVAPSDPSRPGHRDVLVVTFRRR